MNEQEAKRLCALRELVRETFAQTLMVRTDTISDTADFFDELGGDSLDSLDVAVHLEEICGQRVPEEEYALCRCVEDAALLLLRLEQGGAPEAAPEEEKTVTPITRFEDTPESAAFQQRLRTADETGVTIVQNYSIDALPFLSYDLLSVLSAVLTALLVGLLVRTSRSLRMYPSVPYWQVTSYHPFTSPLTVTMVPALMVML